MSPASTRPPLLLTLISTLIALCAGPARADTTYALVIGVNHPLGKNTTALNYADDDAILFHRLFAGLGHSTLLVAPDAPTTRLHGAIPGVRPPTRANVERAIDEVLARVRRARASGWRPHLYLIYSGHGDVKNNQGYLALEDGRFTSRDLARLVLARSRALTNHVIVDACSSYYLVHDKRAGGRRRRATPGFHRSRDLARRFPNTGFLLSTSSATNSHEWAEFQAGIFSHEVRSGLLGGADVDLDGRVTYDEIWAFIRVANSRIPNERFRPHIYLKAPYRRGDRAILDLRGFTGAAVTIPGKRAGRYLLEDRNGVRLADVHTSSDQAVRLRLTDGRILGRRSDRLYLHDLQRSKEYLLETGWKHRRQLAMLPGLPSSYRPKGAAHEAFGRIFERPFSLDACRIELQCTDQRQRAAQCPSYYCDRCRCEGCRRTDTPPPPPPPPGALITARPDEDRRRPWETIVEVSAGFRGLSRSFGITDPIPETKSYRTYESGFAPAFALALETYPLASFRSTPLAPLGISIGFFSALGLKSQITLGGGGGGELVDTALNQFVAGLVWRWVVWDSPTSLSLKLGLDLGRQEFRIDDTGAMGIPDITYVYLRFRFFKLDVPLFQRGITRLSLQGAFNYLHVFSAGPIEDNDARGFGRSNTGAVEFELGARLQISRFFTTLSYAYSRFFFDFDASCTSVSICNGAGGALDVYQSFNLMLGYAY